MNNNDDYILSSFEIDDHHQINYEQMRQTILGGKKNLKNVIVQNGLI